MCVRGKGKSYRSTNEVTPLAAMAATTNNGAIKKANNRTLSNNTGNEGASSEGCAGEGGVTWVEVKPNEIP